MQNRLTSEELQQVEEARQRVAAYFTNYDAAISKRAQDTRKFFEEHPELDDDVVCGQLK